jgi:hypothetical protein
MSKAFFYLFSFNSFFVCCLISLFIRYKTAIPINNDAEQIIRRHIVLAAFFSTFAIFIFLIKLSGIKKIAIVYIKTPIKIGGVNPANNSMINLATTILRQMVRFKKGGNRCGLRLSGGRPIPHAFLTLPIRGREITPKAYFKASNFSQTKDLKKPRLFPVPLQRLCYNLFVFKGI